MKKLIIASGSPRRRELLTQIGLTFEVITSDAPEITSATDPGEIVMDLSHQKAQAVQDLLDPKEAAVILGADTIVFSDGQVLGKPADEEAAFAMLKKLAGHTHQVYTGVTLLRGTETHAFYACTQVECFPMTDEEIRSYIATGDPMDKAGAYGIQGPFAAYVKGICGDYNNVVGLPVSRVYQELKRYFPECLS